MPSVRLHVLYGGDASFVQQSACFADLEMRYGGYLLKASEWIVQYRRKKKKILCEVQGTF